MPEEATLDALTKEDIRRGLGLDPPHLDDSESNDPPPDPSKDSTSVSDEPGDIVSAVESKQEDTSQPKSEELEKQLIEDMLDAEPSPIELDEDDEDKKLQEGMKKDQIEAFKKMRRENHAFEKRVKELESQVAGAIESDETKAVKEELARVKQQLSAIDLSQTDEFKAKFDEPIKAKAKQISAAGVQFGIDQRVLHSASQMGIKQRYLFLTEHAPEASSVLTNMMSDLDSLRESRINALKESQQTHKIMLEERARKHGEAMLTVMNSTIDELKKTNILLIRSDDEKWNELVDERVDNAKTLIAKSGDPQALAEITLKAAMCDDYRNFFLKSRKEINQLKDEIGKRKKATPNIGGSGRTAVTVKKRPDKPRSAEEIAELVTGMPTSTT